MKLGLAGLLAAVVCGCASTSSTTTSEPMLLIDSPEPARWSMLMVGHPDARGSQAQQMFFGQQMATGGNDLMRALAPQSFHPGAAVTEALMQDLARPDRPLVRVAIRP
jgi:hypothetical protein